MVQSLGSQPTLREWYAAVIVNHLRFSDGITVGGGFWLVGLWGWVSWEPPWEGQRAVIVVGVGVQWSTVGRSHSGR